MRGLFPLFSRRKEPEKQDFPPRLTIKVGRDGAVYLKRQPTPVDIPTFDDALRQLRERDGFAVYYRERPDELEPPEAVMLPLQRMAEAGVKITMGQMVSSEWGTLSHVEIEEAPMRFRLFISLGQPLLIGMPAQEEGGENVTMLARPEDWTPLLSELDFHVRSDRVRESPQHRSGDCFRDSLQKEGAPSGLHLRIGYNRNQDRWASYYPMNEVPDHIQSFYLACRNVAQRLYALQAGKSQTIAGEDALRMFS